jgi:flagellar hook-associated protein 3 FlgL
MTISFQSILLAPRQSVFNMQKELTKVQTEASTGRHADVGLSLGSFTTQAISLRSRMDQNSAIVDTNNLTATNLDLAQSTMKALVDLSHTFVSTLVGARNAADGQTVVKNAARAALQSLQSQVNVTNQGQFLFAGINSNVMPMGDYMASPAGAAKTATDAAFAATFGFPQSSPAVGAITPAQMDAFLTGNFAAEFTTPNWEANWSQASSENRVARIDQGYSIEVSANANEDAFRNLAKAFTAAYDLGTGNLSQASFEKLVDSASGMASAAAQQMGNIQGRLGAAQQLITTTTNQLKQHNIILTREISALEGVDQYEAATRVTTLTTQLETSYSITARISKLNLMNYL